MILGGEQGEQEEHWGIVGAEVRAALSAPGREFNLLSAEQTDGFLPRWGSARPPQARRQPLHAEIRDSSALNRPQA